MSLLEKQDENQQFQDKFKDTSSVPKNTSSLKRKRESIVRTYEEPVLPKVAKILFISMIILTFVAVWVDLKNGIPYVAQSGLLALLENIGQSALTMWGLYTVLLVIICGIGMLQNRTAVRRKAMEGCANAWTKEDDARCARAIRRLNATYRSYLFCGLIGTVCLLLFWGAIRTITQFSI